MLGKDLHDACSGDAAIEEDFLSNRVNVQGVEKALHQLRKLLSLSLLGEGSALGEEVYGWSMFGDFGRSGLADGVDDVEGQSWLTHRGIPLHAIHESTMCRSPVVESRVDGRLRVVLILLFSECFDERSDVRMRLALGLPPEIVVEHSVIHPSALQ